MKSLFDYKVIPVVVLNNEEEAKNKLGALNDGGLSIAEITFRTPYALEGIKYAIKHYPKMLIGAGTVINKKQCEEAIKAGCSFIVSPGLSEEVAITCAKNNIPYIPGCITPTEIMKAIELGITTIKFFPASDFGGIHAINSLGSAFPNVKFVPTGGVNMENLKSYFTNTHNKVVAVGGSWMMSGDIKDNCSKILCLLKDID